MDFREYIAIALLVVFGCVAAQAEMSSSSYKIPSLTISSGGEDEMSSSSYKIQDIKGQGVIGVEGDTIYKAELGGIYGLAAVIVVEEGVPYGTVPLNIIRDGDNIRISWADIYANPQIFVLSGDGYGQYVNDGDDWLLITDPLIAGEFDTTHVSEYYVLHNDQVAAGSPEAYYKGLQAGVPRAGTNPDTGDTNLASAWAVGKVNVGIEGTSSTLGKNLFSIPFLPQPSASVADVLGEGSGSVWDEGDMIQYKIAPSPAYLSAVYTGGQWKDAADTSRLPQFDIDHQFGNWVVTNSTKTITLVGDVVNTDESIAIYDGTDLPTGGKTLLGMVYPVAVGLSATSLIPDGAEEGDMIQYKDSPLAPSYISAVVIGGVWKNAANPADPLDDRIGILRIPHSYTFVRYGPSGFSWNRGRPF